jgi:periplasmic divalent cation tolerance protein
MKCRESGYDEVERLILKEHAYDTPEIVAAELVRGSAAYFDWIDEVTESGSERKR